MRMMRLGSGYDCDYTYLSLFKPVLLLCALGADKRSLNLSIWVDAMYAWLIPILLSNSQIDSLV